MVIGTRIQAVMANIQDKISSRTYLPGTRLPSVRAQAKIMNVSVSTVVEAYERLMAEGMISSKKGSGFYVCGPIVPLSLAEINPQINREIDPLWISRQALESNTNGFRPGCGWLPPEWLYEEGIRRALRKIAKAQASSFLEYATPLGHSALRQLLARRLNHYGLDVSTDQIMLTESGTQSIDLICRFLLKPGDTVLVDDPCYFNFHALLKAHHIQVIGIPFTPNGTDLEKFEKALTEYKPRLYITNSGIHNPTGATLSPTIAHKLLKLIDHTDLIIVEDDIFSDFEINPAPRLSSLDGFSKVIQIGSFSKSISASIRCGYIVTQSNWIEKLVDLKIATSFGGCRLAEEIVYITLTDSGYRKHMQEVHAKLATARINTINNLKEIGIETWHVPQAGMFLWCILPDGIDATTIVNACLKENIILAPGNAFSQSLSASSFLRFNVAQSNHKFIFETLNKVLMQHSALNI